MNLARAHDMVLGRSQRLKETWLWKWTETLMMVAGFGSRDAYHFHRRDSIDLGVEDSEIVILQVTGHFAKVSWCWNCLLIILLRQGFSFLVTVFWIYRHESKQITWCWEIMKDEIYITSITSSNWTLMIVTRIWFQDLPFSTIETRSTFVTSSDNSSKLKLLRIVAGFGSKLKYRKFYRRDSIDRPSLVLRPIRRL